MATGFELARRGRLRHWLRSDAPASRGAQVFMFVSAMLCVLLALEWGGTHYSWSDGRIIALFIGAALSIVFLAVTQTLKGDNAGLPPQVLKNRSITCGALFMFLLSGAFFILIFYVCCHYE